MLVTHGDAPGAIAAFWKDTRSRYNLLQGDKARPLLPPEELFLSDEVFFAAAKSYGRLVISASNNRGQTTVLTTKTVVCPRFVRFDVAVDRRADDPLGRLKAYLATNPGRVLLLAESAGRRETLAAMLAEHGLRPAACADFAGFAAGDAPLALGVGPLHAGFALPGTRLHHRNRAVRRRAAPQPPRGSAQGELRQLAAGSHRAQGR